MVNLFLDFDGVLHPDGTAYDSADCFCFAPRLAQMLEEFPNIGVVISSSWREEFDPEEYIGRLGALGKRITGKTPVRPRNDALPGELWSYVRHGEIHAWLEKNNALHANWIALDDSAKLYAPECPNLMLIDRTLGFTEADAVTLTRRLREIS